MAKRFTDTAKWGKPRFTDLPIKMKIAWIYLCDNCDHAGVWDINMGLMSYQVGAKYSLEELTEGLGGWVEVWGDKLIIPSFVEFQYSALNPDNRVHRSVIERLERVKKKPLPSPIQGAKDKDTDTDTDTDTDKEGGVGETEPPPPLTPQRPTSDDWKHQLSTENITRAKEAWHECLRRFGAGRSNLLQPEEETLARAIKAHGIVAVEMACRGFRAQKPSDRWNPAEWIDVRRVFSHDNFMRFVNLGVAEFHKQEGAA